MYNVSQDYMTAIAKNARAHKLVGTVNGASFDGDDIIRGSFQIKNQFCPATEIALGGVYVGELNLTFSEAFKEVPSTVPMSLCALALFAIAVM